jgi:hypothetical protein
VSYVADGARGSSASGSGVSPGSSREASPSEPPEDPELAAQRRLQEDVVLMQATKIRAQRATKVCQHLQLLSQK